jgi:hypothetical protein
MAERGRPAASCGTMDCCATDQLCERCYGRELTAKRPQARVVGECWAERICRGELRRIAAWPEHGGKAIGIARRLVSALAKDPRLVDELAVTCSRGAAAWWQRRPARYRA